jgi:hypothetical protein
MKQTAQSAHDLRLPRDDRCGRSVAFISANQGDGDRAIDRPIATQENFLALTPPDELLEDIPVSYLFRPLG